MDSDLDMVVLTSQKDSYVGSDDWIAVAVRQRAPVVRRMGRGPLLTERRVRLETAFEIELGFAPLAWASTDPVDRGTTDVVKDGCEALYDPDGMIAGLLAPRCDLHVGDHSRGDRAGNRLPSTLWDASANRPRRAGQQRDVGVSPSRVPEGFWSRLISG